MCLVVAYINGDVGPFNKHLALVTVGIMYFFKKNLRDVFFLTDMKEQIVCIFKMYEKHTFYR